MFLLHFSQNDDYATGRAANLVAVLASKTFCLGPSPRDLVHAAPTTCNHMAKELRLTCLDAARVTDEQWTHGLDCSLSVAGNGLDGNDMDAERRERRSPTFVTRTHGSLRTQRLVPSISPSRQICCARTIDRCFCTSKKLHHEKSWRHSLVTVSSKRTSGNLYWTSGKMGCTSFVSESDSQTLVAPLIITSS